MAETRPKTVLLKMHHFDWCDLWDDLSNLPEWDAVRNKIESEMNKCDPTSETMELRPYRVTVEKMLKAMTDQRIILIIDEQLQSQETTMQN